MQKISVNGLDIAYERHGKGAPLMLVHGFPLDHTTWQALYPYLETQFDVIMPDLPGFGQSALLAADYDFEKIAEYLAAMLDALKINAAYIAGHSMGGYVALAFARTFPGRLLGLGMLASQSAPDDLERKKARYASAQQVTESGVSVLAGMAVKLSADKINEPFFREIILRQPALGVVAALKAMAKRPDSSPFLTAFNLPVVLVHGLADELIPPARSREMKALLPQAQLVELPGVGHTSSVDAPRETALALNKFLENK